MMISTRAKNVYFMLTLLNFNDLIINNLTKLIFELC